jgi:hypothetical protein
MGLIGFAERIQDDGSGDATVRGDRECVAGVVVEPTEDFGVGLVGEAPGVKSLASVRWVVRRRSGCRTTLGRFAGVGVTSPAAARWRLIEATDTCS